jgi:hypothetical protein
LKANHFFPFFPSALAGAVLAGAALTGSATLAGAASFLAGAACLA